MSRYSVPCESWGPDGGEAVVGWDPRRCTYFAHTYRYGSPTDEPAYAIGLVFEEIQSVVELVAEAYAFAEIDDDTIAALLEDPEREAAGHPPRLGVQPLTDDPGFATSP